MQLSLHQAREQPDPGRTCSMVDREAMNKSAKTDN